jgi:hypothetical protein
MQYAIEMGSFAMIHIISFIKCGSGIQKFYAGVANTHREKMEIT